MHHLKPRLRFSGLDWLGFWFITSSILVDPAVLARLNNATRGLFPDDLEPMDRRPRFPLDHRRSTEASSTIYDIRRMNVNLFAVSGQVYPVVSEADYEDDISRDIGFYIFGYDNARDSSGNEHFRFEQKFANGTIIGEYGFTDNQNSAIVTVTYVADQNGYRPIVNIRRLRELLSSREKKSFRY